MYVGAYAYASMYVDSFNTQAMIMSGFVSIETIFPTFLFYLSEIYLEGSRG